MFYKKANVTLKNLNVNLNSFNENTNLALSINYMIFEMVLVFM